MPDREKVIKGVHDARKYLEDREWVDKSVGVHIDALNDAIALLKEQQEEIENLKQTAQSMMEGVCLLKEQEEKVLTVDQLEDALDTVVWLETPVSENLSDGYSLIMAYSHKYGYMYFDSPFGDNPSQDRLEYSEYGKSWRCWDKRPTDEQRQAVKWDEQTI